MLEKKLEQDYIQAMKSKDTVKSGTLSFLRAQVKYAKIDKHVDALEDAARGCHQKTSQTTPGFHCPV